MRTTSREAVHTANSRSRAAAGVHSPTPIAAAHRHLFALQRTIGNRAVARLINTSAGKPPLVQRGKNKPGGADVKDWKPGAVASAKFTNIPTKDLEAHIGLTRFKNDSCFTCLPCWPKTVTEEALRVTFKMQAEFTPAKGSSDCGCGEYRQYVKGWQKRRGKLEWQAKDWIEDGSKDGTGEMYGRRATPFPSNRYYDKPAADAKQPADHGASNDRGGCLFRGEDTPSVRGEAGEKLEMDLDFKGELVDACDGDKLLKDESGAEQRVRWNVKGEGVMPGKDLPF